MDRRNGVLTVRRTLSDGKVVELAKTDRSRRQVPLTRRALAALDEIPPRLDTRLLFPAARGGVLNIDNFRRREWAPAIEAAASPDRRGSTTCARPTRASRSQRASAATSLPA